jgi:hypothetical protein
MDRIIKAFTFKTDVYAEVESDTSFTTTAWLIVAVVSLLNALGSIKFDNIGGSLLGALFSTVFAVIGFALAAFVINLIGRAVFKAEVTFEELVRTVGLAYVWQAVGLLGILGAISATLSCLVAPALVIGAILWLVSAFIAAKEALDLEWVQTIITVVLGWIAFFIVMVLGSIILGLLGVAGAAILGAF